MVRGETKTTRAYTFRAIVKGVVNHAATADHAALLAMSLDALGVSGENISVDWVKVTRVRRAREFDQDEVPMDQWDLHEDEPSRKWQRTATALVPAVGAAEQGGDA